MRQVFSVLLLSLAAVLAVASLSGYQVNQVLREEDPVRHIAGDLPQHDEFSDAVGAAMVSEVTSRIPDQVEQFIPGQVDSLVSGWVSSLLDNERVLTAWDESLQQTRENYTAQLEELFHTGSTGDADELAIQMDLTAVSAAVSEPLREQLESLLGWIPGFEDQSFDFLAPEMVVDIEAATDEAADPYTWATAAVGSQYWLAFGIAAGVVALAGVLLGPGRWRGAAVATGAAFAGGLGLWIALTVASPDFQYPLGAEPAVIPLLDHVQSRYTEWAQPPWWFFSGVSAFMVLVGVLVALLTRTKTASRSPR